MLIWCEINSKSFLMYHQGSSFHATCNLCLRLSLVLIRNMWLFHFDFQSDWDSGDCAGHGRIDILCCLFHALLWAGSKTDALSFAWSSHQNQINCELMAPDATPIFQCTFESSYYIQWKSVMSLQGRQCKPKTTNFRALAGNFMSMANALRSSTPIN